MDNNCTTVTEHEVEAETMEEAENKAIKLAGKEIPGAACFEVCEVEEVE